MVRSGGPFSGIHFLIWPYLTAGGISMGRVVPGKFNQRFSVPVTEALEWGRVVSTERDESEKVAQERYYNWFLCAEPRRAI